MNVQEQMRECEGAWNRLLAAVKDVSADEQISLGMTLAVASYVGQEGFRRGLSLEQCGEVGMAMSKSLMDGLYTIGRVEMAHGGDATIEWATTE